MASIQEKVYEIIERKLSVNPEQITPEIVEVDGVRYSRFTIARHALVPLRTGELVVPARGGEYAPLPCDLDERLRAALAAGSE